ncbi:ATP-dependent DNA helicase [Vibrio rarus]|uniref:ATP-dependent DNA helicase n=1 Tax=Vibrio rarus TaxID=413403 RepID=UPI0021C40EB3|nr:ATP-dependent DNA helicase [Vibrio rarus]
MKISSVFSADGALGQTISGFQPRDEQTMMAERVYHAIQQQQPLVIEAGTGTGKTFAYLAPALLSGKKTIVSTGSKNLQEQLFHRDLPLMKAALGFMGRIALLKGRGNYLCLDRLSRQIIESHSHSSDPQLLSQLVKVRSWSSSTQSGDLGECEDLAEDSKVIPDITSTNENCLGKDCPSFAECFVFKARNKALQADLVVVNHHLFLADMAVKETGFGELLPEAEVFIFDEAHQIPDIASQYFGQSMSSKHIADLAKDIEIGYRTEAKDMRQLQKVAEKLTSSAAQMRLALGEPGFRGNWRDALKNPNLQREIERLNDALQLCRDVLKMALGRSQLLDTAFDRTTQIHNRLTRVCDTSIMGYSYWFECTPRHFSLNITPLSVANKFQQQMDEHGGSWIFTSATLSVSGDFQHFTSRLGLKDQQNLALSSPFDFQTQARLCVPRYLPEPNSAQMAQHLVTILTPVIEANKGRCFFLCTSHSMMKDLTERFRQRLDLPVLMQGESSKQALLKEFTQLGDALLVATGAFWEGIDVRGDALSCVIIDKLPFTPPDDPLLKARIEDCKLNGGEPFYEVQLPDAVIALKQGVGRLIRDTSDKGALIICDNRLVTRDYGKMFLSSLPPIPRTRSVSTIIHFLQSSMSK